VSVNMEIKTDKWPVSAPEVQLTNSWRWRDGDDSSGNCRTICDGSTSTASHCLWRPFCQLILALFVLLGMNQAVAQFSSLVPPPKVHRTIEDKKFELIETGLEFWPPGVSISYSSGLDYGFWLSDTLLVTSVLQDVPDAFKQKLERIMLLDVSTGKSHVLIEQGSLAGRLGCRNRKHQVMVYYPKAQFPHESFKETPRFVRLDDQGKVSDLTGPPPIKPNCDPIDYEGPPPTGNWSALREGDGYIDRSERDDYKNLTNGKARLIRPRQPPLALDVDNKEINLRFPAYLPYYKKYLLGTFPHHGVSGTDRRVAGGFWKHSYAYSPYRLISRTGEIEEISYPTIIFDFGLKGFQHLWPTPHGLLIETSYGGSTGVQPRHGLLLLKGDRMFRLWGGSAWSARGGHEATHVLSIAPNGCHIVFTHSDWRSYPGSHLLSILNLCKDQ
jgi:hypothetical protein